MLVQTGRKQWTCLFNMSLRQPFLYVETLIRIFSQQKIRALRIPIHTENGTPQAVVSHTQQARGSTLITREAVTTVLTMVASPTSDTFQR